MKPTIIVAHEHLSTVLPDVESGDGREQCHGCGLIHASVNGGQRCLERSLATLRSQYETITGGKPWSR